MASFAKTQICGFLGRDVELKFLPSGDAVAKFSVATSERFKKDGEQQEKTLWWSVTVWGRQAETCNQYLSKGSQVWIDGKPGVDEYTSRDGEKKFALTLRASDVQFLGEKGGSGEAAQARAAAVGGRNDPQAPPVNADDIPF